MSAYDPDNIFARILRGEIPNHTVFEDDSVLVFMDVMPQSKGHCLVVPKAPSRNLLDANESTLAELLPLVQKIARAAKTALRADGIRIAQFNEPAAGQTVFHLHVHIIPVYEGVAVKPHSGDMADHTELAAQAKLIAAALE